MGAKKKPTGEWWCAPTRELGGSQLIRLRDESRDRAAPVEEFHDEPTRECPAGVLELLERERAGRNRNVVSSVRREVLGAVPVAQRLPLPGPITVDASELAIDQVIAALAEAEVSEPETPPARLPVQRDAPNARAVPKRGVGVRVVLCITVLGVIGAGVYASIGM